MVCKLYDINFQRECLFQFLATVYLPCIMLWQAVLHKTTQYNYQETCLDDYREYSLTTADVAPTPN